MEIIKNNGKRCLLWLSCDCCDGDTVVVPDSGAYKVVEEPEMSDTVYPFDTIIPTFPIQPYTELVHIGGVTQTRGVDYTIDYPTNTIFIFHGNEPKVPYENVVISYITGDHDMNAIVEANPTLSSTVTTNDTINLQFVPVPNTIEVFIGGVAQTPNKDYSVDVLAKKITIFAGNEPKVPYESVTIAYIKQT